MEMRNPHKPDIKKIHSKYSFHTCKCCDILYKDFDMWEYKYKNFCKLGNVICSNYICDDCAEHSENVAIKKLMKASDYKKYIKVENRIKKLKSKHKGK